MVKTLYHETKTSLILKAPHSREARTYWLSAEAQPCLGWSWDLWLSTLQGNPDPLHWGRCGVVNQTQHDRCRHVCSPSWAAWLRGLHFLRAILDCGASFQHGDVWSYFVSGNCLSISYLSPGHGCYSTKSRPLRKDQWSTYRRKEHPACNTYALFSPVCFFVEQSGYSWTSWAWL